MDYKKHQSRERSLKNDVEIIEKVMKVVSDRFGVRFQTIFGNYRGRKVVEARHAAMYLIYKNSGCSVTDIGILFGRDHTSVTHAVQKIDGYISVKDPNAIPVQYLNTFFTK